MSGVFGGLKVWDASWVGVGPLTAKYLADYGATVVRTETSRSPDLLRTREPFQGPPGINTSQFWADFNTSKYGLGVDFRTEEGHDIGLRLARWADVVVESFSPGVMERLGFGYPALKAEDPSLVMLSTSMNGQYGPRRSFAAFGSQLAAAAGFSEITGWPDRPPSSPWGAYTDFICQRLCATALVAALDHRRRTGLGQHIDLAQYEGGLQLLAPWLLDLEVNGRTLTRDGNRDPHAAPHGIYPCLPEDGPRWIAIAVRTDAEWAAFTRLIGSPEWAGDERFRTLPGRKEHEDALDAHVAAWTAGRPRDEIFHLLQPEVPAGPVLAPAEIHRDPQLAHRRYLRVLEHSAMGQVPYEGPQAELSATPPELRMPAPCLGEHSRMVLTGLLGLTSAEADHLIATGVVEQHAAPTRSGGSAS